MKNRCKSIAGLMIVITGIVLPAGIAAATNTFGHCHNYVGYTHPSQNSQLAPGQSVDNAGPITVNKNGTNLPKPFDGGNTCSSDF